MLGANRISMERMMPNMKRHFIEVTPDELRDLVDALAQITGDKGREYESAQARFEALRHRLAGILDGRSAWPKTR